MSSIDGRRSSDEASSPPEPAAAFRQRLLWLLLAAGGVLLWVTLLIFPARPIDTLCDDSWNTLLAHDLVQGLQFGRDTIFTYGPLAYLFSPHPPFDPQLHGLRMFLEFFGKAFMAIALLQVLRPLQRPWEKAACLAVLLAVGPLMRDPGWLLTIGALTVMAIDARPRQPARIAILVVTVAILSAAKFTLLILGAVCIACVAVVLATRRAWRAVGALLLGYLGTVLVVWAAAGQQLTNLPAYLHASLEITSGYNQSQAIHGPLPPLFVGGAAVCLIAAQCGLIALVRPLSAKAACSALAVGTTVFLCWKAGFVRQDEGHMLILFPATAVAPFFLPRATGKVRARVQAGLTVGAVGLSAVGFALVTPAGASDFTEYWRQCVSENLRWVTSPIERRHELEARLDAMRIQEALPQSRERIGNGTVDVISYEQGILFLNDLRIRHRPVIQSYSAYTPFLQRVNGEFFLGDSAPDFVLVKVQPTDGHLALAEDSGAWRAMLQRYLPVLLEHDYLLLQRRVGATPSLPEPVETSAARGQFGEWIEVPAGGRVHELELDIRARLAGRLRMFLLRPPAIWLDVRTRDGGARTFTISPCIVQAPFVVDPLVGSNAELVSAYLGTGERVAAFRLRCWSSGLTWIEAEFGYRIPRHDELLPRTEDLSEQQRADLVHLAYPMFSIPPARMEPRHSWSGMLVDGRPALLAEAPMRIEFDLRAGTDRLFARFGILPAAYAESGETDGVTFRAAVRTADGDREVFRRHLDPRRSTGDRGLQSVDVDLGQHPACTLVLETTPGPDADNRWDFSYWADVSFGGGQSGR